MSNNDKKTTMQLSPLTVNQLRKLGNKGDTYDDIIRRLMVKPIKKPPACVPKVGIYPY